MLTKRTADCPPFTARDGCEIRELLHPEQDAISLPYSLAQGSVGSGGRTFRHKLAQQEVYWIRDGSGVMHVGAQRRAVMPGDVVLVPAGVEQWIENTGVETLVFVVIVSPPWRAEDDTRTE